jgi:hypothetical protein
VAELFHVHRIQPAPNGAFGHGELTGREIELEHFPAPQNQPGADVELARLFPDGLSFHGRQYMTQWPQQPNNDWALEGFLEAVRRAEFANRPSRMTSLFAFERLEDARAFAFMNSNPPVEVYRLDVEIAHRANFSLLRTLAMPVASSYALASAYWKGEQGPAPVLWEVLVDLPVTFGEIVPLR